MKLSPISLAVLTTLSISSAAIAAPSQSTSDIEVIEVRGTYFNDYKVDNASGAMRTDTPLLETAQSVTVIPETIINEQLATTLGEVLANDASLTPGSKQRNRETFNSRGFGLSSSNGYLRNGHQHWSHYQQPIETLESVEVIKGPSSILYGQSAPGGLVNMVTKKPTAKSIHNISTDVDQHGSTRFMLDSGGALTQDEALRYRGVLVKQDVTYEREYQNGDQRERDRFLGSLVLDYDVSDELLVSVHYDRTDDKAGLDTGAWLDAKGKLIGDSKRIYDFSWAFTDITVKNLGADVRYFLSDNWQVKLGYNEQTFKRQRFESSPKKPGNYQSGGAYTSKPYDRFDDWQFKTAFVDFTGEVEFGGVTHNILVGANSLDYYYGQLRIKAAPVTYTSGSAEPSRPNINYRDDDSLYSSSYDYYGIYLQDLITFNDHWQLSLGARYDKQNKKGADNESTLPKLGLMYHPVDDATVYVSYSEGFEPQRSETLNNELDRNHGMKLDAVTSKQVELGGKWQMSERLLVSGAYFDIEKSGTLISESLNDGSAFDTVTTQSGLQQHKGMELAAQGAVSDRLFVMASAMYLDARYERDARYQGKVPVDAPKWSSSLWSRYEVNSQLAINAGLFYQGERYADTANTIVKDAYTRIDLGATYSADIAGQAVDFRFNVENLFDKDYLGGGGTNNVTVGDGATARFEIKTTF